MNPSATRILSALDAAHVQRADTGSVDPTALMACRRVISEMASGCGSARKARRPPASATIPAMIYM